jgi:hypothetical protein
VSTDKISDFSLWGYDDIFSDSRGLLEAGIPIYAVVASQTLLVSSDAAKIARTITVESAEDV